MEKNERNLKNSGAAIGANEAAKIYADNIILQAERGHGFAAEKANHFIDKLTGKVARLVGGDNAKDGADRIVNGIQIQTKYCASGSKCISDCFDEGGKFRYLTKDGRPMEIEVPSDMYESAIQSMQDKIQKGKIPGLSDPEKASEIVRKGNVTYQQAKNVARFGTVEGLTYDAANGIGVAGQAGTVSAAVAFAMSLWQGKDSDYALKAACETGLQVGGVAFITTIVSSQAGRTGVELALRPASDWVISQLGYKTTSWIATSLRTTGGLSALSGASAANHLSKLLRGNAVSATITTLVVSSGDFIHLFEGRISLGQAFKNIGSAGASVAGGIAGAAAAGAALGSIVPGAGTIIGGAVGLLGGLLGGLFAGSTASAVLDAFIEDDATEMLSILNEEFGEIAFDYLLSEKEANSILSELEKIDIINSLRDMYAAKNRKEFAKNLLTPLVENEVKNRQQVRLPNAKEILVGLRNMINEARTADRSVKIRKYIKLASWSAAVGLLAALFWHLNTGRNQTLEDKAVPTEAVKNSPPQTQLIPTPTPTPTPPPKAAPTSPTVISAKVPALQVAPPSVPAPTAEHISSAIAARDYTRAIVLIEASSRQILGQENFFEQLLSDNSSFYSETNKAFELLLLLSKKAPRAEEIHNQGTPTWHSVLYNVRLNDERFSLVFDALIKNKININQLDSRGHTLLDSGLLGSQKLEIYIASRGACTKIATVAKSNNYPLCK